MLSKAEFTARGLPVAGSSAMMLSGQALGRDRNFKADCRLAIVCMVGMVSSDDDERIELLATCVLVASWMERMEKMKQKITKWKF
mmetsp:Transcript_8224/g.17641  ORF Transcript_8224/g.17641 Transcript_8224/m.17641 type:complete len:85 (-) Transcript_8224:116-370(-)